MDIGVSAQLQEATLQQEGGLSLGMWLVWLPAGWVSGCHRCTSRRIQKLMEESLSLLFLSAQGKEKRVLRR